MFVILVLLATDGYANSFREDRGFLKVGTDLLGMLRSDGLDHVKANLGDWLRETSEGGSGDDITRTRRCALTATAAARDRNVWMTPTTKAKTYKTTLSLAAQPRERTNTDTPCLRNERPSATIRRVWP